MRRAGLVISAPVISMKALPDVQRSASCSSFRQAFQPIGDDPLGRRPDIGHVCPKAAGSGILKFGSLGLTGSLIRRILCAVVLSGYHCAGKLGGSS